MKRLNLLFLIIIFVLLVGCSKTPEKLSQYNFKQGVAEMRIDFIDRAPPEEIYPNSDFKMVVQLDNQMGYDATTIEVNFVGLNRKYFDVSPPDKGNPQQSLDLLKGRSITAPDGDKKYFDFSGNSGDLFQNAEEYLANYFLTLSYFSKIEFTDTVCINPNIYEIYDSGCKFDDLKSYSGQGAPLAVDEIEEIILPGDSPEIEFRIRLKNKGKGKIKLIDFDSAKLGSESLNCKFQNSNTDLTIELKKEKQEAILICSKTLKEKVSYTTTLLLDFTYQYELEKKEKLKIIK
jgi:hypothetical protein